MRLEGVNSVFVLGDLAMSDEPSTEVVATQHDEYIGKAITALSRGKKVFVPFGEYVFRISCCRFEWLLCDRSIF